MSFYNLFKKDCAECSDRISLFLLGNEYMQSKCGESEFYTKKLCAN